MGEELKRMPEVKSEIDQHVNFDHASVINITKEGKGIRDARVNNGEHKLQEKERKCVSGLHVSGMQHFGVRKCSNCDKNICDACRDQHMRIKHPV